MNYKIGTLLYSFLLVFCIIHLTISEIRKCGNPECQALISKGKTTQRYPSIDKKILSSQINEVVQVFGKSVGTNKDLWDVEINNKRGLFPSKFIKEELIFIRQERLINVTLTPHNLGEGNTPVIDRPIRSNVHEENIALTGDDADFKVLVKNTQMGEQPMPGTPSPNEKIPVHNLDQIPESANELTENDKKSMSDQDMNLIDKPINMKIKKSLPSETIANAKYVDSIELKNSHDNLQNQQRDTIESDDNKHRNTEHIPDNLPQPQDDFSSKQQPIPNTDSSHLEDSIPQKDLDSKIVSNPQIPQQNVDKSENIVGSHQEQQTLGTVYADTIPNQPENHSEETNHPKLHIGSTHQSESKTDSIYQKPNVVPTHGEDNIGSIPKGNLDKKISFQKPKSDSPNLAVDSAYPEKSNTDSTYQASNVGSTHQEASVDFTHHRSMEDSTRHGSKTGSTNQNHADILRQDIPNPDSNRQKPKVDSSYHNSKDKNPNLDDSSPLLSHPDSINRGHGSQQKSPKLDTNHHNSKVNFKQQEPNVNAIEQENSNFDSSHRDPKADSVTKEESDAIYITNNNVDSSSSIPSPNSDSIIGKDTSIFTEAAENPNSIPTSINDSNNFSMPKPHSIAKNLSFDPKLVYKNMGKPPLTKRNNILENSSGAAHQTIDSSESNDSKDSSQEINKSIDVDQQMATDNKDKIGSLSHSIDEIQANRHMNSPEGSSPEYAKVNQETASHSELYTDSLIHTTGIEPSSNLDSEKNPSEFFTTPNEVPIFDNNVPKGECKSDPFNPLQSVCKKNIHDIDSDADNGEIPSISLETDEQNLHDIPKSEHVEGSESQRNYITPIEDETKEQPSWYVLATEYIFLALQPMLGEDFGYILESEVFYSKISLGSVTLLIIMSATIVMLYLLHLCITKMSKEAPLLKEMSSIKREMRFTIDENLNLKNSLTHSGDQVETSNMNAVDANAAAAMQYELVQTKENCSRIVQSYEEKMHRIEQELDESTSNGLEMHKMLDELLQSQKDSTSFQASVDGLQNKLDTQKLKVESLTTDLAMKTHLNDELRSELKTQRVKVAKLDSQIEQLGSALQESKTSKAETYKDLKSKEAQIKKLEDARQSLTKEVDSAKVKIDHLTERGESLQLTVKDMKAQLSIKDAEIHVSKECCKKLQKTGNKNVNLSELFGVIELKRNLKVNEKEMQSLKRDLEKSVTEKAVVAAKLLDIEEKIEQFKNDREQACLERNEAESKLNVLTKYFKDKESELTRELESQEHLRIDAEGSFVGIENQVKAYETEISSYRSKLDTLKVELEEQKQSYKMQLSNEEKKSHDNWISARASERRLDELRKENGQLRQKLTLMARDDTLPANMLLKPLPNRMEANGNMSSPTSTDGDLDRTRHSPLDMDHVPPHLPPFGMPPMFPGGPHMPPPPPSFMAHLPPPPPLPDRRLPPAGRIASPSFRRASPPRYNTGSYSPSSDYSNYSDRCYSPERNRKRNDISNHVSPPTSRIPRRSPSNWCMPPNDAFYDKNYPQNYATDRHHLDKGENASASVQNDR